MKRRKFSMEEKQAAVARHEKGETVKSITEDLKIAGSVFYNWTKKVKGIAKKAKAKSKAKKAPNKVATAIVYLHHARDAAVLQVTENPDRFDDPVYGLAMMALRTLEGTNA